MTNKELNEKVILLEKQVQIIEHVQIEQTTSIKLIKEYLEKMLKSLNKEGNPKPSFYEQAIKILRDKDLRIAILICFTIIIGFKNEILELLKFFK